MQLFTWPITDIIWRNWTEDKTDIAGHGEPCEWSCRAHGFKALRNDISTMELSLNTPEMGMGTGRLTTEFFIILNCHFLKDKNL